MSAIRGVCAAVLTPLTKSLEPDAEKAIPYYAKLLADGCDALNVLGSTGQAWSLSVSQRIEFMKRLAQGNLPLSRMMAGTAGWSLEDSVRLTRSARELGFSGTLIMPRLEEGARSDADVLAFFDALLSQASPGPASIYLYNFPKVSGLTFTPALVRKLLDHFPGVVAGLKDSSNDLTYAIEITRLDAALTVFPSSESHLLFGRRNKFAGCISGTVCLWPELAHEVWNAEETDAEALQADVARLREEVVQRPLVAALRQLTAEKERDPAWLRTCSDSG